MRLLGLASRRSRRADRRLALPRSNCDTAEIRPLRTGLHQKDACADHTAARMFTRNTTAPNWLGPLVVNYQMRTYAASRIQSSICSGGVSTTSPSLHSAIGFPARLWSRTASLTARAAASSTRSRTDPSVARHWRQAFPENCCSYLTAPRSTYLGPELRSVVPFRPRQLQRASQPSSTIASALWSD